MRVTNQFNQFKKIILSAGLFFTALGIVVTTVARGDVNASVQYLSDKNDNSWVTMALLAAGKNPSVEYLRTTTGSTAISYAAPILALTAADKDPRIFPSENLVDKLKSFYDGAQIGDASALNDDIFGVLALVASGESTSETVVQGGKTFILNNQSDDGGWGWVVGGGTSVDMTAMGIAALMSAGVPASDPVIQNAIQYLTNAQNVDGGFPSESGGASNTASTAWALSAMNKLGANWLKGDNTPATFLNLIQTASGYFPNTAGGEETGFAKIETAYAVIALSGKSYPLNIIEPAKFAAVHYRIEGATEVICAGDTRAPNALTLVKIVANECGVDFDIEQLSFGPYLTRIGSDQAAGLSGWLYFVNFISPEVGAADYRLEDGDDVLWYFGEFGWSPLRVTLKDDTVATAGEAVITVESKTDSGWTPLAGVKVYLGSAVESSGAGGLVVKTLPDGVYRIFAEQAGYVRSAKELLTVGDKAEAAISLSATVTASANGGNTGGGASTDSPLTNSGRAGLISFLINPGVLDFETIETGKNYSKPISINNDGQVNIYIESAVSGDDLFRHYLQVAGQSWRSFSEVINQGEHKDFEVGLSVPGNYDGFGRQAGSLTFWAIQNQ